MVNVTASYSPKTFAFEGSKLLLDLCLADSRILYFWYVLKSIHKFIIELHAPQCLFEKGSNKKQRRGRIIWNFTKGETFSFLMTKVLLRVISQCGPYSCTPQKKAFLSPSIWTLNWNESSLISFENCLFVPYFLE